MHFAALALVFWASPTWHTAYAVRPSNTDEASLSLSLSVIDRTEGPGYTWSYGTCGGGFETIEKWDDGTPVKKLKGTKKGQRYIRGYTKGIPGTGREEYREGSGQPIYDDVHDVPYEAKECKTICTRRPECAGFEVIQDRTFHGGATQDLRTCAWKSKKTNTKRPENAHDCFRKKVTVDKDLTITGVGLGINYGVNPIDGNSTLYKIPLKLNFRTEAACKSAVGTYSGKGGGLVVYAAFSQQNSCHTYLNYYPDATSEHSEKIFNAWTSEAATSEEDPESAPQHEGKCENACGAEKVSAEYRVTSADKRNAKDKGSFSNESSLINEMASKADLISVDFDIGYGGVEYKANKNECLAGCRISGRPESWLNGKGGESLITASCGYGKTKVAKYIRRPKTPWVSRQYSDATIKLCCKVRACK